MRIVDLLNKESILLNASPASKQEAIDMLVDLQVNGGRIADKEAYKKGILASEYLVRSSLLFTISLIYCSPSLKKN